MTAPAPVQHTSVAESTTDAHQITLTGVTAGNLLVLSVVNDSAQRGDNPTITDTQSNSWSKAAYADNVGVDASGIFYAEAGASGDVTVTVTWSGNDRVALALSEVSGQDGTTPLDQANTNLDASGTTHYCAPTGEIDTAADVIVFYTACGLGNFGTVTPPSGSTFVQANSGTWMDNEWCGYLESDSALTDHRGQWTSSIARTSSNAIASFKAAAGGGGTTVTPGVLSLQVAAFAPVVSAPNPVTVTPGPLNLEIVALAPIVSTPVIVTPGPASLQIAVLAPVIATPVVLTPGTASAEIATFAPVVSAPVIVTPGVRGLEVTAFAPVVTFDGSVNIDVPPASLQVSSLVPTVTAGGSATVTPGTLSLQVETHEPAVSLPVVVTPALLELVLTPYDPSIVNPVTLVPGTAALEITTHRPSLGASVGSVILHYYNYLLR